MRGHVASLLVVCCAAACGARSTLRNSSDVEDSPSCETRPWIVFSGGDYYRHLFAMRVDGSGLHGVGFDGFWATASGDGTKLLFHRDVSQLVLRDLATHEERVVVESDAFDAALSRDGALVAYTDSNSSLHAVSADGSNEHVLFHEWSHNVEAPVFSVDGTTVYFLDSFSLRSIRLDGTGLATLSTGPYLFEGPSFSLDGTTLVVAVACGVVGVCELRKVAVASLPVDFCAAGTKLASVTCPPLDMAGPSPVVPSWGPYDKIVYTEANEIVVLDPTGTTTGLASGTSPQWVAGCMNL